MRDLSPKTGAMRKVERVEHAVPGVRHPRTTEQTTKWVLRLECGHVVVRYACEGDYRTGPPARTRCGGCPTGSTVAEIEAMRRAENKARREEKKP